MPEINPGLVLMRECGTWMEINQFRGELESSVMHSISGVCRNELESELMKWKEKNPVLVQNFNWLFN